MQNCHGSGTGVVWIELGGKVRGTFGDITDNRSQHAEGKIDELKGKAQKNLGKAQGKVEDLDRKY